MRAKPGTVKAKVAALKVGDTLPADNKLDRNKFYVTALRLGITLQSQDGLTMKRTA